MAVKSLFVTATDTDAGKTFVSCLLLQGLAKLGVAAAGVKPIAAGADEHNQNGDALLLRRHSGIALPYRQANPICYQAPVAPHLAAEIEQQPISEATLDDALNSWQQLPLQQLLIEGAGGWLLPISDQRYLADWVGKQQLPVLLVVGMKLGCLNHAMLTVREIARSGCELVGWMANCVDPEMALSEQNIADLKQRIPAPCLGVVPYAPDDVEQVALNLAKDLLKTSGCNTR
ncbi:dethiobiotin synthase [Arsukibacterium sp.]|uniref:dethiobiotin synthase n=1 Tax=Arsukibacterium sp. TaxID=1977258 RepID=UPI001BD2170B|nr:dethiobiotin synthase [Arsukibacterium sp.]